MRYRDRTDFWATSGATFRDPGNQLPVPGEHYSGVGGSLRGALLGSGDLESGVRSGQSQSTDPVNSMRLPSGETGHWRGRGAVYMTIFGLGGAVTAR